MITDEKILFDDAFLKEIQDKFYYVHEDYLGRKRQFFENSGGSLRLKAAVEEKARLEKIPDCPERIHDTSMMLKQVKADGMRDIMQVIFGAKSGALVTELTSSQVMFQIVSDVINLPAGATPIDFAYSIHSAIGNSMVGATVNGRIVNFDYVLQNGDIVDIRTSKNAPGPSRDWLNLAKSGAARTKIKQWFKKERREENIVHGKEQFERELRANGIAPADIMGDEILPLILKRLAFTSLDDLYAAIGYGGVTATRTVNRIRDEILRNQKANQKNAIDRINEAAERRNKRARHAVHGILVEGLDNCLIKFSRCCTPVPGDGIIGFITRGAGVSIHRTDCENYLASRDNPETAGRWIRVSWAERTTDSYSTTLMLLSAQRSGLVMDVATALNTLNAKVRTLTARDVDSGRSTITITVEVHDLAELRTIISRLSAIRGVIRISRSGASDPAKAAAHTAELQAEQEKKAKQEGKA